MLPVVQVPESFLAATMHLPHLHRQCHLTAKFEDVPSAILHHWKEVSYAQHMVMGKVWVGKRCTSAFGSQYATE